MINIVVTYLKNNRKAVMNILSFLSFTVALIFLFILVINLSIVAKTNDNIYSEDEIIKLSDDFDCILILGAGVKKDGSPTDMLYDRLKVGSDAFTAKKSSILLLSGDSEYSDYTETETMKQVLNSFGVEDKNIICDGYGLSTYESIWRAKYVYGCKKILIVTQKYHLYRAIYIAQEFGLDAYGLDSAIRTYRKQPIYSIREYLARIKDMIFSELSPNPKYTNRWEEIYE